MTWCEASFIAVGFLKRFNVKMFWAEIRDSVGYKGTKFDSVVIRRLTDNSHM